MENSKQAFIQIHDYNNMGNFNFSENQSVTFLDKKITALKFKLSYIFMFFN